MKTVSIIIPTFNRMKLLSNLLIKLKQQSYPSDLFEVLVCSDGSTDKTKNIVMEFKSHYSVRFFDTGNTDQFGAAKARNLGIRNSTKEIILFLDDDMLPNNDFIREHVESHKKTKNRKLVVFGPRYGHEADSIIESNWESNKNIWIDLIELLEKDTLVKNELWKWAKTDNMSIYKKELNTVGGFNEGFNMYGYEDTELIYRLNNAGFKFEYNPRAITNHINTLTKDEINKKKNGLYKMRKFMLKIHPEFNLETSFKMK